MIQDLKLKYICGVFIAISANAYISKVLSISPVHLFFLIGIASFYLLSLSSLKSLRFELKDKVILISLWLVYLSYGLVVSGSQTGITAWLSENIGIIFSVILLMTGIEKNTRELLVIYKLMILSSTLFLAIEFLNLFSKYGFDLFRGFLNIELMYDIKKDSLLYLDTNFTAISALVTLILLVEEKRIFSIRQRRVLIGFVLFVFLLMFSRAAVAALLVYLIIKKIRVKYLIISGLAVLSLLLVSGVLSSLLTDNSLQSKFEIIFNTLEYIDVISMSQLVLGGGAEFAIDAFQLIDSDLGAHLMLVVILVNYGLLGLAIYLLIMFVSLIKFEITNFIIPIAVLSLSMVPVGFPSLNIAYALLILVKLNSMNIENSNEEHCLYNTGCK